ncbi:hypothetical protein GQ53DRAFT_637355 [Thozetella sp. PMI_491]|nr:hypothetical protein GQ53DRAFT_637355 [Thozetella sp. PMI_491]
MTSLSAEELFEAWHGQLVPRSFNPGFVTLSYVVSLIGSASTLELINRRTAPKGVFNHVLLISAAVAMGGIAIWCMHYIGIRAIDIAAGEPELQIAYSSGFTALSFFVPIVVLMAAFVAIGTDNRVSWWRVGVGGAMAGTAICGMHYLGNASISNYVCQYNVVNVVGSAIIAVAASIAALSLFFIFRAAWTSSWWKRGASAIVLAGAVSGMHWCASTGTQYRLVSLNLGGNEISRNTTVIVVICLSIGACFVMAGTAIYTARVMKRYANKAQQVVLASAIFDQQGRVLVTPDGLLPSEKITDTFVEKTAQDSFTVAHPLFHWMFQASRNWSSIDTVVSGMRSHLAHLPHSGKEGGRGGIELINEHGDPIDNYDIVFRELFCAAAQALAFKIKATLPQVGVLWDEILPTGSGGEIIHTADGAKDIDRDSTSDDLAEKGLGRTRVQEYGRGALMFLVRHVDSPRELEALEAAGFRFAELHQVSGIIGSSMQIKTRNVEAKLRTMQVYADDDSSMIDPGVHMGFFGVRARVGAYGFDILVRREARNQLPSIKMPLDELEPWQISFLQQFDRLSYSQILRRLENLKNVSPKETIFASHLADALQSLRGWIGPSIFDEAVLTAHVVEVPCRAPPGVTGPARASMISVRIVIPIHMSVASTHCEFVPLGFFKVNQLIYPDSPHHLAFSRSVHREMAPILNNIPLMERQRGTTTTHRRPGSFRESRLPKTLRRFGRPGTSRSYGELVDGLPRSYSRSPSPRGSAKASSTKELWSGGRASPEMRAHNRSGDSVFEVQGALTDDSLSPSATAMAPTFGGIMVSQEITINVHEASGEPVPSSPRRVARRGRGEKGGDESAGPASVMTTIEMKNLERSAHHNIGAGVIVANASAENETPTFVDELFAICVDQRQ